MLKDEFERVQQLFRDASEGKLENVETVFKEALAFFEHLKEYIAHGSPEDKMQAIQMMGQIYQQMMQETQRIIERSGMSEDQLAAFAQDPSNFTKEQWEMLQASKQQIAQTGVEIAKVIAEGESASLVEKPKSAEKSKPKEGPEKHSKWMRT